MIFSYSLSYKDIERNESQRKTIWERKRELEEERNMVMNRGKE